MDCRLLPRKGRENAAVGRRSNVPPDVTVHGILRIAKYYHD